MIIVSCHTVMTEIILDGKIPLLRSRTNIFLGEAWDELCAQSTILESRLLLDWVSANLVPRAFPFPRGAVREKPWERGWVSAIESNWVRLHTVHYELYFLFFGFS